MASERHEPEVKEAARLAFSDETDAAAASAHFIEVGIFEANDRNAACGDLAGEGVFQGRLGYGRQTGQSIVRVFDNVGADGSRELSPECVWIRTTLLDRIDAGEVPYRAKHINEKQALRIRERWEKKITYRYSILVRKDDPTDDPVGVIREWDASAGDLVYEEEYVGSNIQQWMPSSERWESEDDRRDKPLRILASDAATVNRLVSSWKGR